MRNVLLGLAACLFWSLGLVGAAHAADRQHVIVIDQSGSMEPFFNHPDKALHKFLQQLVTTEATFGKNDQVTVLLFSEPGAAAKSPLEVFRGKVADLGAGWSGLQPKLTSVAQWTRLVHGLQSGVDEAARLDAEEPRLVWFLTDNVAEDADSHSREDTQTFYEALRTAPEFAGLSQIQVFPVDLKHPTATMGLMLYAMLYNPDATAEADELTAEYQAAMAGLTAADLPAFMEQRPLLVKPLSDRPFRLEVTEFRSADGKKVVPVTVKDGVVTLPSGRFREGEPIEGELVGRLVSNFETFRIPSARMRASLSDPRTVDFNPVKPGQQKIDPEQLGAIDSQAASQPFTIRLELPPMHASWNLQSVFLGTSGRVQTDMQIEAELSGAQGLEFDTSRIKHLTFHEMAALPKLFAQEVKVLPVAVTIDIPVAYSTGRFLAGLTGMVVLLLLAVLALVGLYRLFTSRELWILTMPDRAETTLAFGKLFGRKHPVLWNGYMLGWLKVAGPNALRFERQGEEPTDLTGGGSFSVQDEEGTHYFQVERKYPDQGGADDVA
jgi:hypothetical protein